MRRIWTTSVVVVLAVTPALAGIVKEDYSTHHFDCGPPGGIDTVGAHRPQQKYTCDTNGCEANLVPTKVTYQRASGDKFFGSLTSQYPGWTFQSAANELSDDSLVVHSYAVFGSPGFVGAELDLEYVPHGNDPTTGIHWIQVIWDNHNITNNPGHGNYEQTTDVGPGSTTPYYDEKFCATNRRFYDRSGRGDGCDSHYWNAELHLVREIGPKQIVIYGGVLWGWENHCVPEPGTFVMIGVGLVGALRMRRRK